MKKHNKTAEEVKRDIILGPQPTKEFVTVEQVAALALFLTTDAAKSINGALLSMDGGWTAA
jgi:3-hydroxybutyrate dehydrogenase